MKDEISTLICLGQAGSFSHEAGEIFLKRLGRPATPVSFVKNNEEILPAVAADPEAIGVIAVENTTAGFVLPVIRSWLAQHQGSRDRLYACGELWLPVRHCLLGKPGTGLTAITTILSHPQALNQCRRRLREFAGLREEVASTSFAAERVAQGQSRSIVAIASRRTAEKYGLEILEADIQDEVDNQTHFFLVSRFPAPASGRDRSVLMFRLRNTDGTLYRFLEPFAEARINLSCLESIREGTGRSTLFYAEADCHLASSDLSKKLSALTKELVIMGSFPIAD